MATDFGLTHRWSRRKPKHDLGPSAPNVGDIEPVVARVLAARWSPDEFDARDVLQPSLRRGLHDPSLMPDLDRAADRLREAARGGEAIAIYGDYDVDGITASAILFHMLRAIAPGARLTTYVPHRLEEGYGLNESAIRELAASGHRVIVSVDCGITAIGPANAAREEGVDLIITDHHNPPEPGDEMPEAFAVVHPRRPGSRYPFGELCGAGVAFKLAWRLATLDAGSERVDEPMRELLLDLLALAAMGTVADIVPLVGENRAITKFGLARVPFTRFEGLGALIGASGLDSKRVDAEDVGFKLGPRLNAAGRLGHASQAVELLTAARGERAEAIARELSSLNNDRRAVEKRIFEQACEAAEASGMTSGASRSIVLAHENWHPGVVGIVCSRLVRAFGRPAVLMQRDNGRCQGSGRSIDGYSIHAGLTAASEHLTTFGGHDMAAGLSLESTHFDAFAEAFEAHARAHITEDMLRPALVIDTSARIGELSIAAAEQLTRLGPFGRGNPRPIIELEGLTLTRSADAMGAHGKHLCLHARDDPSGRELRIVGWDWGDRRSLLPAGTRFDAAVRVQVNRWNGSARVEAELQDVRLGCEPGDGSGRVAPAAIGAVG